MAQASDDGKTDDVIAPDSPPQIYFIVHNRNHVNIFHACRALLETRGISTHYCAPGFLPHAEFAKAALTQKGLSWIGMQQMDRQMRPQDLMVVAYYAGPPRFRGQMDALLARGNRMVGVVEGGRFARRGRYSGTYPMLGWGPSADAAFGARNTIVGAPVIEAMQRFGPDHPKMDQAVINYKFNWGDAGSDEDLEWLETVLGISQRHGLTPVVSRHPAMSHIEDGVIVSDKSIDALLAESRAVITRSSTVVYQAMMVGTQPFLYPLKGEHKMEFSKPMGAFPIARRPIELNRKVRFWCEGQDMYEFQDFMDHHVSILPDRPAPERMADALMELMSTPDNSH